MRYKPVITVAIVVINVIVFFVLGIFGDTEDAGFLMEHGAMYPEYVREFGQYWRLFTACFLHFGFLHLLNNMFILICSGPILEKAIGHVKFLILYLCAGIGGSFLSYIMMLKSGDYAVSAGASGAIFGVIGALLWVVVRNKGHYESLSSKGIIFMIVLTLYYGVTAQGIDNWGHVGGLVSGFLVGIILYRKRPKNVDFNGENTYTYY